LFSGVITINNQRALKTITDAGAKPAHIYHQQTVYNLQPYLPQCILLQLSPTELRVRQCKQCMILTLNPFLSFFIGYSERVKRQAPQFTCLVWFLYQITYSLNLSATVNAVGQTSLYHWFT